MLGIAQKLFNERTLKSSAAIPIKKVKWPFLERMVAAGVIGYVDFSLANRFLHNDEEEAIAVFICHLSLASRLGHICIKIEKESIVPCPSEIWIAEDVSDGEISFSDREQLNHLILQGAKIIAPPLICNMDTEDSFQYRPVYKNKGCYYLQRNWELETLFLNGLKQHLEHPVLFSIDSLAVANRVESLIDKGVLLIEQAEAIMKASQSSLTLITGGPGTGKTYTAGLLLRTIWDLIAPEKRINFKVVLAAPTGKAAANLELSIQRSLSQVEDFPAIKAQTLHQLLGLRMHGVKKFVQLSADLILVDESSMIDINMMGQLLSALKPGARLVLLGDRNQLPSVEAGSLFADLSTYFLSNSSRNSCVAELKMCLRTELRSIIDLADHIKNGDAVSVLKALKGQSKEVSLVELKENLSVKEQQRDLLRYVESYFPVVSAFPDDPLELLSKFSKFRILTPMRKGVLGVDALNAAIFQTMNTRMLSAGLSVIPIMVMQNDYHRDLFNGEVGLLIKDHESEYALFPSRESRDKARKIPALLMPRFEYAYCLSVHKSQGSEFDHVVLILPSGSQGFGREALYTGVTRAKKRLEIWSCSNVLSHMVNQIDLRQSGVVERLST